MSRRGLFETVQVVPRAATCCEQCGHAGPAVGCRCCEAKAGRRRPGRLRGKGFTKSAKRKPRRRRRRR